MKNPKNTITNIAAIIIVVATALKTALDASAGTDINWLAVVFGVTTAVIGYLTGKKPDGKAA
jgi:uncharacterized membrane protein